MIADRWLRVLETPGTDDVYAFSLCSVWSRRALLLFESEQGSREVMPRIAIGGRYAAFTLRSCHGGDHDSYEGCRVFVKAYDAKRRRGWKTALPSPGLDTRPGAVTSLVVTARGWTAWAGFRTNFSTLEVWAMAPGGAVRKLAEGPTDALPADSVNDMLAVNGDRLYWQFGETPGTAVLR